MKYFIRFLLFSILFDNCYSQNMGRECGVFVYEGGDCKVYLMLSTAGLSPEFMRVELIFFNDSYMSKYIATPAGDVEIIYGNAVEFKCDGRNQVKLRELGPFDSRVFPLGEIRIAELMRSDYILKILYDSLACCSSKQAWAEKFAFEITWKEYIKAMENKQSNRSSNFYKYK